MSAVPASRGNPVACPLCRGLYSGNCYQPEAQLSGVKEYFDCDSCGQFEISTSFKQELSKEEVTGNAIKRAALSIYTRGQFDQNKRPTIITGPIHDSITENISILTPIEVGSKIIQKAGECFKEQGEIDIFQVPKNAPSYGAFTSKIYIQAFEILLAEGSLSRLEATKRPPPAWNDLGRDALSVFRLTAKGWERYHKEASGRDAGNYGFVALKFGNVALEKIIKEVLRPKVKEIAGLDLKDMRDLSEAGVIDNIMRERIRMAKFVLADLTDENSGAYWEAGYAEGLNKPVIYLCSEEKFEAVKPHFDVNYCTIVQWQENDESWVEGFVATLTRSLARLDRT